MPPLKQVLLTSGTTANKDAMNMTTKSLRASGEAACLRLFVFLVAAALAVAGGIGVIAFHEPIRSVLSLVVVMVDAGEIVQVALAQMRAEVERQRALERAERERDEQNPGRGE